ASWWEVVGVVGEGQPSLEVPDPLERQLKSELDLPRVAGRSEEAELRGSQDGGIVGVLRASLGKQEVRMVQKVEEFRAKFQSGPFASFEILKYRQIPGLVTRPFNSVPAYVAVRTLRRIS